MYNTNFVVKYHDIERELVINLRKKALKKQEEETAALIAKATAAIAQREREIKELIEKQESNASTKKGGKKKALKENAEVVKEEPKKRGRKKAIKEEVKEEPIKEEPIEEVKVGEDDDDEDIEYTKTKKMLEDIKHDLVDFSSFTGTPTEMENIRRNADYIIFITLFSQHIFYITHICVCQLYTINDIDDELVNLLKERMINLFKKN
jgi:hypothetical protein